MAFSKKGPASSSANKGQTTSYKVSDQIDLLTFLIKSRSEQSRSRLKSLLTHRQILVNGQVETKFNRALNPNDIVEVCKFRVPEKKAVVGIKIIFEDDSIIVFDKPANVTCAPSKDRQKTIFFTLSNHVKSQNPKNKVFFIRPLEEEISGIMIAAKTEAAKKTLEYNAARQGIKQKYVAVVRGTIEEDTGIESHWLQKGKNRLMEPVLQASEQAHFAVLTFKVLNRTKENTYVEFEIEGKVKHQIRAQFAGFGHPVLGDTRYKSGVNPIGRVAIHAKSLSFKHPKTGKMIDFRSPVPTAIKQIGKR